MITHGNTKEGLSLVITRVRRLRLYPEPSLRRSRGKCPLFQAPSFVLPPVCLFQINILVMGTLPAFCRHGRQTAGAEAIRSRTLKEFHCSRAPNAETTSSWPLRSRMTQGAESP